MIVVCAKSNLENETKKNIKLSSRKRTIFKQGLLSRSKITKLNMQMSFLFDKAQYKFHCRNLIQPLQDPDNIVTPGGMGLFNQATIAMV
jgi:hypothetical protein